MTRTASFTTEEFVADRTPQVDKGAHDLTPAAKAALDNFGQDGWADDLIAAALDLFDKALASEKVKPQRARKARKGYAKTLTDSLAKTTAPSEDADEKAIQVARLANWLASASTNSATLAAAGADREDVQWVTMHDNHVRSSHREVDGTRHPPGATFKVNGYDLHYPGEPVGPPEVWINCRCALRSASGGDMATTAAATPVDQVDDKDLPTDDAPAQPTQVDTSQPDPQFSQEAWDALEFEVPWYGVLAPVGVMSGDRRMFASGSITSRDLPVPVKWMPTDLPGHDGSVVVGNIEAIFEEDGLIKGSGRMRSDSADGNEVIDLVANQFLRGFSVDLDAAEVEYQNADGTPFDMETWDGTTNPIEVLTAGRVSSVTICPIPAFQEGEVHLGTWEDAAALTAACLPCHLSALIESENPLHAAEVTAQIAEEYVPQTAYSVTTKDGTVYSFDETGTMTFAPGTHDGPGWITHPEDTERLRTYWTKEGEVGAAKIGWGAPGDFNRCRKQLAKYIVNPHYLAGTCANLHKVALGVWPGHEVPGAHAAETLVASAWTITDTPEALVAAGAPVHPAEWFMQPGLNGPTAVTVTDEGRVYGHVATWGVCHIGIAGDCITPPTSAADYAYYRLGAATTDQGDLAVGRITMGTGHAPKNMNATEAMAHYDNTGTVVAYVNSGEDDHGIWIAGALRTGLTPEQIEQFKGSVLSGDWRTIGGHYELVAALAVNVPGFPIPRTGMGLRGTEQVSLVASGIVSRQEGAPVQQVVDVATLATQVADTLARRARAAAVRDQTRTIRTKAVRAALKGEN